MRYGPRFEFAHRQDGRRVAYQVVGEGDLDLVFLFGWPTHLGLMWENPSFAGLPAQALVVLPADPVRPVG